MKEESFKQAQQVKNTIALIRAIIKRIDEPVTDFKFDILNADILNNHEKELLKSELSEAINRLEVKFKEI